jgi:archaemetzincin
MEGLVDPSPVGSSPAELDAFRRTAERIRPLHVPKREPRSGDWLASHAEPGQSFAAYLADHPVRPVDRYSAVYVQSIGHFDATRRRIVELTAQLLDRFYGVPASVLPELPLHVVPPSARRLHPSWGNEQILTRHVRERILVPRCPADALALLPLTTIDLWPGPGWNFVFGEASPAQRVGVWSIYRYGDPQQSAEAYRLCLRRTLKGRRTDSSTGRARWSRQCSTIPTGTVALVEAACQHAHPVGARGALSRNELRVFTDSPAAPRHPPTCR